MGDCQVLERLITTRVSHAVPFNDEANVMTAVIVAGVMGHMQLIPYQVVEAGHANVQRDVKLS